MVEARRVGTGPAAGQGHPHTQIGYEVLDALARSEWASEHEGDVIAAATHDSLGDNVRALDTGEVLPQTGHQEER